MGNLRMITWAVVGIIMSIGVVILTLVGTLPPEVFAALAGVAINAVFEKANNASLRKDYQELLAEYRSMIAKQ